jgi:hypothetical protein
MVKGLVVPIAVPVPQPPAYHVRVPPDPPVAVSTILPPAPEQKLFLSTDAEVGAIGSVLTVTVVLTQAVDVQPAVPHDAK